MTENEKRTADWKIAWFREAREAGSWFLVFVVLAAGGWTYMRDNEAFRTQQLTIARERLKVEMQRSHTDSQRATGIADLVSVVAHNTVVYDALAAAIDRNTADQEEVMEALVKALEQDAQARNDLRDAMVKSLVRPKN